MPRSTRVTLLSGSVLSGSVLSGSVLCALVAGCSGPSDTLVAPEGAACEGVPLVDGPLRIATYNIKSGLYSSLDEVGDVLEELDADVVALQEVDRLTERTGREDQPRELADRLGMQSAFVAARTEGTGDYGVALLSRLPFREARRLALESTNMVLEPRTALDATLCYGEQEIRAVSVHADVYPWAAADHARSLGEQLEATAREDTGLRIVAGDLNATPDADGPLSLIAKGLVDVIAPFGELPTFLDQRIDYLLADRPLADGMIDVKVLETDASDHRPVVGELEVRMAEGDESTGEGEPHVQRASVNLEE